MEEISVAKAFGDLLRDRCCYASMLQLRNRHGGRRRLRSTSSRGSLLLDMGQRITWVEATEISSQSCSLKTRAELRIRAPRA